MQTQGKVGGPVADGRARKRSGSQQRIFGDGQVEEVRGWGKATRAASCDVDEIDKFVVTRSPFATGFTKEIGKMDGGADESTVSYQK